jgi:hypothetical protein
LADGDRTVIGGWVVREDHRLQWNQGLSDPGFKMVVTGELGHVRWLLYLAAVREKEARDLDALLVEFAQRVGVEYTPTQRRRETPHDANNAGNAHNGGTP